MKREKLGLMWDLNSRLLSKFSLERTKITFHKWYGRKAFQLTKHYLVFISMCIMPYVNETFDLKDLMFLQRLVQQLSAALNLTKER